MLMQFVNEGLKGKSNTTIKTYHHALQQFESWLIEHGTDLKGYARSDVQQYIDTLLKDKSVATVNKIWNAIKKYSKWANKHEAIEDIRVTAPVDLKEVAPSALTKVERSRLIREIDRTGNKRDLAILLTLLNTGARVSELVNINRADIQITDRKGTVRIVGKGNKERVIPLNADARRAITKYLEERTDSNEALFLSNRMERISVRSVQHLINQYGFNVHKLRHTFITDLVRSGQDISVVKSLSGHSSTDMVMRYSKASEEDKQRAIENLYKD